MSTPTAQSPVRMRASFDQLLSSCPAAIRLPFRTLKAVRHKSTPCSLRCKQEAEKDPAESCRSALAEAAEGAGTGAAYIKVSRRYEMAQTTMRMTSMRHGRKECVRIYRYRH